MVKSSSSSSNLRKRNTATTTNDDDGSIPADVQKVKDKLERETGKRYKYRSPKNNLPSVSDLLKTGGSGNYEFGMFVIVMFLVSFGIFYGLINSNVGPFHRKPPMTLYQRKYQQKLQQQQQQEDPEEVVVNED